MIKWLLPVVALVAIVAIWQSRPEPALMEGVLGVETSPSVTPEDTLNITTEHSVTGKAAGITTSSPAPTTVIKTQVEPTNGPTPVPSDDCDFEYHYDSDADGIPEDGEINVEHHCEKKTDNNISVSNNVDINVSTRETTESSGDVKVDVSVKNKAE